jgi:hypothetical protein
LIKDERFAELLKKKLTGLDLVRKASRGPWSRLSGVRAAPDILPISALFRKTAIHWSPVIDDIAADVPAAFSN